MGALPAGPRPPQPAHTCCAVAAALHWRLPSPAGHDGAAADTATARASSRRPAGGTLVARRTCFTLVAAGAAAAAAMVRRCSRAAVSIFLAAGARRTGAAAAALRPQASIGGRVWGSSDARCAAQMATRSLGSAEGNAARRNGWPSRGLESTAKRRAYNSLFSTPALPADLWQLVPLQADRRRACENPRAACAVPLPARPLDHPTSFSRSAAVEVASQRCATGTWQCSGGGAASRRLQWWLV